MNAALHVCGGCGVPYDPRVRVAALDYSRTSLARDSDTLFCAACQALLVAPIVMLHEGSASLTVYTFFLGSMGAARCLGIRGEDVRTLALDALLHANLVVGNDPAYCRSAHDALTAVYHELKDRFPAS